MVLINNRKSPDISGIYSVPPVTIAPTPTKYSHMMYNTNTARRILSALEYLNGSVVTIENGVQAIVEFSESPASTERMPRVGLILYDREGNVLHSGDATVGEANALLQQIPNVPDPIRRHFGVLFERYGTTSDTTITGLHLIISKTQEDQDIVRTFITNDANAPKDPNYITRLTDEIANECINNGGNSVFLIDGTLDAPKALLYYGFVTPCLDHPDCYSIVRGNGYRIYEDVFTNMVLQAMYLHNMHNAGCKPRCQYKGNLESPPPTSRGNEWDENILPTSNPKEAYFIMAYDYYPEDDPRYDIMLELAMTLVDDDYDTYQDAAMEYHRDKYLELFIASNGCEPIDEEELISDDVVWDRIQDDIHRLAVRDVTVGDVEDYLFKHRDTVAYAEDTISDDLDDLSDFDDIYNQCGLLFDPYEYHTDSGYYLTNWNDQADVPQVTSSDYNRSINKYGKLIQIENF
jgi:hypothetical protein